jgi:hypothetical protein
MRLSSYCVSVRWFSQRVNFSATPVYMSFRI